MESREIENAMNEAYKKAGHNAYFGNGFYAGVEFKNKQLLEDIDELKSSLEINEKLRKEDTDDFVKALNESDDKSKKLIEEIDKLKSKVSNWMDKYTEVNEENKKLKSELKDCTENYNHYVDKCFKLESELKDKDIDLQHYKKMASNNNHF